MDRNRDHDDATEGSPKRMRPDQVDHANQSHIGALIHDNESRCSIMDLPMEALKAITSYIEGQYWPQMELVNRRFQSAVLDAWHDLKVMRLGEFKDEASDGVSEKPKHLHSLLRLLYIRSPKVESISEFYAFVTRLNAPGIEQLAEFQNLKSVDFSRCAVEVQSMAKFLQTSQSRHCLEDLRIVGSLRLPDRISGFTAELWSQINDNVLHQALVEGVPLKLKTFVYNGNDSCDGAFLAGLDASALTTLSIAGNGISGKHLFGLLRRCTQLRELCTNESTFDSDSFVDLFRQLALQCPNLALLDVQGSPIFNAHIEVISECFPNLESLNLQVKCCDAAPLTKLVTTLVKLQRLGFYSPIKANVLKAICLHLTCLTSLRIPGLMVSQKDARLLEKLPELEELFVSGPSVTNQAVLYWCRSFGLRLKALELESKAISDSSIAIIAKNLPRLRRIALLGAGITDVSLSAIAAGCSSLESADLSRCDRITATGVNAVIAGCKKLVRLTLRDSKIRQADVKCEQLIYIFT